MCWNISAIAFALKICRGAKISEFPFFYVRNLLKKSIADCFKTWTSKFWALPDSPAPWSMLRQQKFCWTISARWHNPSAYWSGLVISMRSLENSATMETGGNHWDWLLASQMAVFLLVGCFSLFFHKEIWRWTRLLEYHHATEKDSSQKVFNIGEDPEFIMSAKKSSVMSHQLLMSWNQCDFWPERDHHVIGNQLLWLKCKKDCRPLIWLKLIDDISVYYRYVRYVYVYIYDNI